MAPHSLYETLHVVLNSYNVCFQMLHVTLFYVSVIL